MNSLRNLSLTLAVALLAANPAPARAAESLDACTNFIDTLPVTISVPGTYCLRDDLLYSGNVSAINVNVANVTIDCNGHRLTGQGNVGAIFGYQPNLTVRRCTIVDFGPGIDAPRNGARIEANRLQGIRGVAIYVGGSGSTVRGNVINDVTCPGPASCPRATAGIRSESGSGVVIEDNVIDGVTALAGTGKPVFGILVDLQDGATIAGNQVGGLVPDAGQTAYAIMKFNGAAVVRGNSLYGPGVGPSFGLHCGPETIMRDNTFAGFATDAYVGCIDGGGNIHAD